MVNPLADSALRAGRQILREYRTARLAVLLRHDGVAGVTGGHPQVDHAEVHGMVHRSEELVEQRASNKNEQTDDRDHAGRYHGQAVCSTPALDAPPQATVGGAGANKHAEHIQSDVRKNQAEVKAAARGERRRGVVHPQHVQHEPDEPERRVHALVAIREPAPSGIGQLQQLGQACAVEARFGGWDWHCQNSFFKLHYPAVQDGTAAQ